MQAIQQKIKNYINTAIGYVALMAILGLVLLIFPGLSLDIIRWSLAAILIVSGLGTIINDIRKQTFFSMLSGSLLGVFMLVMGIIIIVHPDVLAIIPIIIGAWMVVTGAFSLRLSATLKEADSSSFWLSVVSAAISIICGFALIFRPMAGAMAITSFLGAAILVYSIFGMVDLFVFRRNMEQVAKTLKDKVKIISQKK
jgi:uncharacterized membrane protein HdeD (DUF308 family)